MTRPSRPRAATSALSTIALCAGFLSSGCGKESQPASAGAGPRGAVRFPVEIEVVSTRPVEYTISAVGSVEAFEIVELTARVAGAVEAVRFLEGDRVEKGGVLVEIEPERYRLAVETARAAHARAVAEQAEADAGVARREGLAVAKPGLISGEELQEWRTRAASAAAQVAQAQAALDRAEMDARDARVAAPLAGILQTRTVRTGQYVQAGTVLGTLVRRDPLLLRFAVPEREAGSLHAGMEVRFRTRDTGGDHRAAIQHVAAVADLSSRMVAVTARVDGDIDAIRPGAFAEVIVPIGARADAPVVPQTAVRPTERGFVSFVLEDGQARERVVALGLRTADGRVEVRGGLEAGDSLVVRGAEALADGARVRVSGGRS